MDRSGESKKIRLDRESPKRKVTRSRESKREIARLGKTKRSVAKLGESERDIARSRDFQS